LTDKQWEQIKDFLLGRSGHVGAPAKNNRAGISWHDLLERFGDFRVVHLRHIRWSRTGVWHKVFTALNSQAENEYALIDSTIVRAHQHSASAKRGHSTNAIGRSHGGLSTKIHASVDALGNPTRFQLTGGQESDFKGADVLLASIVAAAVLADKGYVTQERVVDPPLKQGKQ